MASSQNHFATDATELETGVGKSVGHDSARLHITGEATYQDDLREYADQLHVYARLSDRAHAKITKIDLSPCYKFEGVHLAISAKDVPGQLDIGPVLPGDPMLAEDVVEFYGQPVIAVAAEDPYLARKAAMAAIIEYEDLPAILTAKEALEAKSFLSEPHQHKIGDSEKALAEATHRLQGEIHVGGQEHFYLESQITNAIPTDEGGMRIYSSTQNPTEIQHLVAGVLGIPFHKVVVDMRRMGGSFGGKETQASSTACIAAVVAHITKRPARMRLFRKEDMLSTGKRHPFYNTYDVGFDDEGRIQGIEISVAAEGGYSPDLTNAIADRAMYHSDNAYYLGNATITGYRCKTNTCSHTAYRGFGGPQGMLTIEMVIDEIARKLGKDPLEIRKLNYYGKTDRNVTHYHQTIEDNVIHEITADLEESAEYAKRRAEITEFNKTSPFLKKGLALTPVKFGISFTATFLNQAGALVHIYTDGSIHLSHGGTEMGQGLNTKIAQVVAEVFQVDVKRVQITAANTEKVPNTSPTAASSGADLNGMAAFNAASTIRQRLVEFAASQFGCEIEEVEFKFNKVIGGGKEMSFDDLIQKAYFGQISLSSTGYYKTPKIFYDRDKGRGRPFYYYAYGAAVSEVLVDTLTGEYKVTRADLLHDVGDSLNPVIDLGQIEGAFIQGMGWLTTEELVWDKQGKLLTSGPAGYKIPTIGDIPADLRVRMVKNNANVEKTIFRSKAVGEPPFMLSISVWAALKDAIASVADYKISPKLDTPATPERVLRAVEALQDQVASTPQQATAETV